MNHSISKNAKDIILNLWRELGLEMAMEVSGRSRATLFRWKAEQTGKDFKMPTTFEELEAIKHTPMLDLVPDEVIERLLKEGGELK